MHIGNNSGVHSYVMKDEETVSLEGVNEECDLGIWFDKHLKFSTHVGHVVEKANKTLGLIKRSFVYLSCDILKMLFTGIVRPSLEYGNMVWYPRFKSNQIKSNQKYLLRNDFIAVIGNRKCILTKLLNNFK